MPFDGKNFTETKPDVFRLEGLIAWLQEQDPNTVYDFVRYDSCLWAHYTLGIGGKFDLVPGGFDYVVNGQRMSASFKVSDWQAIVAQQGARTYGAALSRALSLHSPSGRGEG